jgi:hypothetical protein
MNRIRNAVPDSIVGKLALGAGIVAFGAAAHEASKADAQSLPPGMTQIDANGQPITPGGTTTSAETLPEAASVAPASPALDDADVKACQDMVIGQGKAPSRGFLKSEKFQFKRGTRTINAKVEVAQPNLMQNSAFKAACSAVTKNSVQLRIVSKPNVRSSSSNVKNSPVKLWGKTVNVFPNISAEQSAKAGITSVSAKLTLPKRLTQRDIKNHRYGVRETVTSQPLIQMPHIDTTNPANNVPGPMEKRTSSRVVWLTKSQLINSNSTGSEKSTSGSKQGVNANIKIYSDDSKEANQKIDHWQSIADASAVVSGGQSHESDHHGGMLSYNNVKIDGQLIGEFTLKTKMKILGFVGRTGDANIIFPKFNYNEKSKTYTYVNLLNGNPPVYVMSVFLKDK